MKHLTNDQHLFRRSAPQEVTSAALRAVKYYHARLIGLRIHGRYGPAADLEPGAEGVIDEAVAYFSALSDQIGPDTQLGSGGTPAIWAQDFERLRKFIR